MTDEEQRAWRTFWLCMIPIIIWSFAYSAALVLYTPGWLAVLNIVSGFAALVVLARNDMK